MKTEKRLTWGIDLNKEVHCQHEIFSKYHALREVLEPWCHFLTQKTFMLVKSKLFCLVAIFNENQYTYNLK